MFLWTNLRYLPFPYKRRVRRETTLEKASSEKGRGWRMMRNKWRGGESVREMSRTEFFYFFFLKSLYAETLEWEAFCSVRSCALAPSLLLFREDHAVIMQELFPWLFPCPLSFGKYEGVGRTLESARTELNVQVLEADVRCLMGVLLTPSSSLSCNSESWFRQVYTASLLLVCARYQDACFTPCALVCKK